MLSNSFESRQQISLEMNNQGLSSYHDLASPAPPKGTEDYLPLIYLFMLREQRIVLIIWLCNESFKIASASALLHCDATQGYKSLMQCVFIMHDCYAKTVSRSLLLPAY